jgi:hypothetical protein
VIRRVSGLPAAALKVGGIDAAAAAVPYFTAHTYSLATMAPTLPRMDLPNPFLAPPGKGPAAAAAAASRKKPKKGQGRLHIAHPFIQRVEKARFLA